MNKKCEIEGCIKKAERKLDIRFDDRYVCKDHLYEMLQKYVERWDHSENPIDKRKKK